jgi:hypothetical protein
VAVCSGQHQVPWKSVGCVQDASDTNSDICEGPGLRNQQQFVLSVGRRLPNCAPRRPRIFQNIVFFSSNSCVLVFQTATKLLKQAVTKLFGQIVTKLLEQAVTKMFGQIVTKLFEQIVNTL